MKKSLLITAMFCAFYCAGQSNIVYYGVHSNAISLALDLCQLNLLPYQTVTNPLSRLSGNISEIIQNSPCYS